MADPFLLLVRRAAPGDARALALVGAASFLEAFAENHDSADVLQHCAEHHNEARHAELLATPGIAVWVAAAPATGTIVGYAMLGPPQMPDFKCQDGDIELKRIYLLHRFQRGGVGRRLMQSAVDEALARRARRLLLGVYELNTPSIAFYHAMGFETVGRQGFRAGNTVFNDLILAKTLV